MKLRKSSLYKRAMNSPARARVVPVWLRRIRKNKSDSEFIHYCYLRNREKILADFIASNRKGRFYRPYFENRWMAWYVEDVLGQAILQVAKSWRFVHQTSGKGWLRQFVEVLYFSISTPSKPENYYMFEWYEPERGKLAKEYLHRYELKNVIYKMLGSRGPTLSDKIKFEKHAKEHGIAVPPTLLQILNGEVIGKFSGLQQDFFVKPIDGKGGRGAERFEFISDNRFRRGSDMKELHIDDIIDMYKNFSLSRNNANGFLFQPRLRNHVALRGLSGAAVATCRVYTLINESGAPECVGAVFRMPATMTAVADNSHQGGLTAAIDMETGQLGQGSFRGDEGRLGFVSVHIDSGAQIEGTVLPLWPEVIAFCIRAHTAFEGRIIAGWDVCISDDGPIMIEGNAQPGTDILQRCPRTPAGNARFGQLIAFHLRKQGFR